MIADNTMREDNGERINPDLTILASRVITRAVNPFSDNEASTIFRVIGYTVYFTVRVFLYCLILK